MGGMTIGGSHVITIFIILVGGVARGVHWGPRLHGKFDARSYDRDTSPSQNPVATSKILNPKWQMVTSK